MVRRYCNPLSVIEQLTYLLFIKRLDELHTLEEAKSARLNRPIENPIFTPSKLDCAGLASSRKRLSPCLRQ